MCAAARAVLCWMVYSRLLDYVTGRPKLHLSGSRTRVALAQETLSFAFHSTVPGNASVRRNEFECFFGHKKVYSLVTSSPNTSFSISLRNSSESGEYYCTRYGAQAHWVILVRGEHQSGWGDGWHVVRMVFTVLQNETEQEREPRGTCNISLLHLVTVLLCRFLDEGYQEGDGETLETLAPVFLLIVLLFIFSLAGSIYTFKREKSQSESRHAQDGGGAGGGRGSSSEARPEEDVGPSSLYAALESRPASIYDVLNKSAMRSQRGPSQEHRKEIKTTSTEGEIFESVYENL
ncbi:NFAT activation molecule 1 isoform X2 [Denticeps clupeoides]|uniref:NFAT activation molecule 1 isoform X2 n=1 Tax=Denticeps clupeoides TaxID=299321 RepID=UPI0010A416C5|nr:uncharacterized protein LOC114785831 isoform X2 [Denticeps clupeoides]